jgi:HTH-type transcriptional regulator, bacterioopsin transcriptional activator and related proteins
MERPQEDSPEKLFTDELQEIVALCDSDGIIVSWNLAGEEITGSARDEVIGYHVDTIISEDSREALGELLRIERAGSVLPGLPVRLQTKFGWDVPAEVTAVSRRLPGGEAGSLLIFRDVTLKSQLQEQLDRMDVLYRGLVENSPDLIYVLDARARVLFINDTVTTLLGYSKRDLLGKDIIDIVHPEDRQNAYWPLRERRKADRATRNLRLRLLTRDGKTRRYDLGFVYVSLDSVGLGRPKAEPSKPRDEHLGTQGVARDVTELVLLQEFSRHAELILPVCSVCHRIRTGVGEQSEWLPLAEYVERKTGVLYSHTYCPEHVPPV